MSDTARLATAAAAKAFILGGNATLTLVSTKTGTRFTYNVRISDDGACRFVSLLSGPDNKSDFRYLGRIAGDTFWKGRKAPKAGDVGVDAPSMKAFAWTWSHLVGEVLPNEQLEIWHEGRCARCNRKLTVPASIASGFGPECSGKAGVAAMREDFGA
jgi:hypothetical protein